MFLDLDELFLDASYNIEEEGVGVTKMKHLSVIYWLL